RRPWRLAASGGLPWAGLQLRLMTLGVGLRLDAPNFSDVFNTIKSGLRYTTAVALLLAYFAAI
ncbi:DUF3218 family protein, partial [Pseudomonas aeruginosa]